MKTEKPIPTVTIKVSVGVKVFRRLGAMVNKPNKLLKIAMAYDGPYEHTNIGQGEQTCFSVEFTLEQATMMNSKAIESNQRTRGLLAHALTAYTQTGMPKKIKSKAVKQTVYKPEICVCGKAAFSFNQVVKVFQKRFFSWKSQLNSKHETRYYRCEKCEKEVWHLTSLYQDEYDKIMTDKGSST